MTTGKADRVKGRRGLPATGRRARGKVRAAQASWRTDAGIRSSGNLVTRVLSLQPLSALPDDRLVALIRTGDERAFDALAARYRRELLVYAERLLGAEGRAEDALQQALLQGWVALRDGTDVHEARAWLYRIVHHCAVAILRRARHDCVELNEEIDAAGPEDGPESRVRLGEVFSSIARLPAPQREAIVMTAIAGRSQEEAAAALGLTGDAVRGLIYRARATLRHAAAAFLPFGLGNWGARWGRGSSIAAGTADAATVAGSAGLGAVMLKGGAVLAAAGVLAGAGPGVLTHGNGPDRRHAPQAHHPAEQSPGGPPLVAAASRVVARQAVIVPRVIVRSAEGRGHGGGNDDHSGGSGDHGEVSEHDGQGHGGGGPGGGGDSGPRHTSSDEGRGSGGGSRSTLGSSSGGSSGPSSGASSGPSSGPSTGGGSGTSSSSDSGSGSGSDSATSSGGGPGSSSSDGPG